MGNRFSIDVFVGAENAFHVTSTIVSGERDAVLIDAQFTRSDAQRLAERIKATGKNLTTVYVTHGHPDHYWGFTTLSKQFPRARFVTAPEVVTVIDKTLDAKVAQWKPMYGDEVPDAPIKPKALDGEAIDLEGNELSIIHIGQGDVHFSTVVWISSLSTIVAGDVAYNGIHVWLAEDSSEQRLKWIENLERLAEVNPKAVIAGHKVPGTGDDGKRVLLRETRDYIASFHSAVGQSSGAQELIKIMAEKYQDRALPIILEISANAAFPGTK
jgi:glyoxylase-like metal-dependent hydrolase (beta-lactamase superfamily II)